MADTRPTGASDACIFCQIVAGESPASVFYEDDTVLGLMDIGPVTTGHAMVIPKRHAAYLTDLDEETGRHLWTITQRTAAAIRESGVRCEGINLFLADGAADPRGLRPALGEPRARLNRKPPAIRRMAATLSLPKGGGCMARRDWYCEDVLSGRIEVERVWEDDRVLAFHHPRGQAEIHVVVIPKEHVRSILDPMALDGELLSSMVLAVQRAARKLGLDEAGFYVRTNAAAPGVTPHMHWHVIGPGIP
jgi:diadenosine tetraphosphate (Ap4A) HIT family hydrolase